MTNQITKNQHQVPQFLLKNFSNNRETINIFKLNDKTFDLISDSSTKARKKSNKIEKRFQDKFFYDNDNMIEDFLGGIEDTAAKVITSIIKGVNLNISLEDKSSLITFISSLLCRTLEALRQADIMLNSILNPAVKELLRLNNFDENAAEEGKFIFDTQNLISMSALNGAEKHLALDDLELALVLNKTSTDFYISDHPVFTYNWLYRKTSNPGVTSIFAKGLQIFLPISYNLTLCLYDPKVYKYGHRNTKIIEIENTNDIDILNSFQIRSANLNLGFRSPNSVLNINELYRKYGNQKIHKWECELLSRCEKSDEVKSQVMTVLKQDELRHMSSFVQIIKASKKDADIVSFRNPDLFAAYSELDRRNYK
jgi:Protein of unknown function (DUF4238)